MHMARAAGVAHRVPKAILKQVAKLSARRAGASELQSGDSYRRTSPQGDLDQVPCRRDERDHCHDGDGLPESWIGVVRREHPPDQVDDEGRRQCIAKQGAYEHAGGNDKVQEHSRAVG